ncbi:hypothetical protein [Deinococcus koreensis]|uniref:Uncharacterized protein n=1 Tax=Deinococcus koreensis TaxID=2054903 RepID=A0A2K3UV17_9DEIO|nr:hypothetical protein [Deinococcus koreensis]PNY80379.1 hypothetical protein CVO96_02470 [Deinococcus koreensis]
MTQPPDPKPTPDPAADLTPASPVVGRPVAPESGQGARLRRLRRVRTPAEERHRAQFLGFLRLFGGAATLLVLAYFMWTPGEWPTRLLAWVALTILADEFGGWFGYVGVLLGGLGYLSPEAQPAQWLVILPLVGGALFALLLVKHSGGPLVLPFAALLFGGTLLAVGRFGPKIDPQLTLPANATFQRTALIAMLAGLTFSFVRQLIGIIWRLRARQLREAQAGATGQAVDLPA